MPSGYFQLNRSLQLLRSYLNAVYGQGDWVKGFFDNQIFLNRDLIEDANIAWKIPEKGGKVYGTILGYSCSGTHVAFEMSDFSGGLLLKMNNNFRHQRSGDVMIALNPGWVEKTR